MKKIIGILYKSKFTEESFFNGCGGSETWAIQLAKEFSKRNYHVIIFCDTPQWYFYNSGVEYVPLQLFESRVKYQNFDYFIFTRLLDETYDILTNNNSCENIYLQSHDMFIWEDAMYYKKFNYNNNRFTKVKKFVALTDYHKWELMNYNNIPENMINVIGNGLDSDIFDEIDKSPKPQIDHSILWTSAFGRGGDILALHIAPLVRNYINDFTINICGYGDNVPQEIKNLPYVNFLGTMNKTDYYNEFRKHACWFLPCVVVEDFGICAPEAIMCGCDVISTFKHGMRDVCYPFVNLAMKNEFVVEESDNYHYSRYTLNMSEEDFKKACQEAANMIIDSIYNYYDYGKIKMRESFKNFIMKEHTWKNVANKWEVMFKINEK